MKSLSAKFLLPFGVLIVLIFGLVFYVTYQASYRHAHQLVHQQLALALEFDLAVRTYAGDKIRPAMEKWVGRDGFIPETMSTSFISRHIFEEARKKFPNLLLRFPSENPRNPINLANPDELRMIEYFRLNREVESRLEEMQLAGGRFLVHFAPRWLKLECMRCHGDPRDAPAELVARYGGVAGFHRTAGDVAALDMVAVPVEAASAALIQEMHSQSIILAAGLLFLFSAILLVFRFTVTRRLKEMAGHFDKIAAHAESSAMTPVPVMGSDEISVVGVAFNRLIEQLGAAQALLELRVSQRTEELRNVNDLLQQELAERKRANDALKESEERYRLIFNHAPLGVLHFDQQGVVLDFNDYFAEIIGAPRERILGFNMLQGLRDPAFLQAVKNALAGELGYYEGDYLSVIGGKTTPLRAIYKRVSSEDGRFVGAVGLFEDITERRRAEQALKESEARFRFLVEHMREGLVMSDASFILEYANPMMSEISGYSQEELIGRNLGEFLSEEHRGVIAEAQRRRKAGIAERYELNFTGKDGRRVYTQVSAHPHYDPQGAFRGSIGVVTDITERKKAEEALARAEEKYRSIFENAMEGIFQTTPEGRFLSVNPALAQILGYDSPEEVIASITDLAGVYVDPDCRSRLLRLIEEQHRVRNFEAQFFRKDGNIAWISFNLRAVRNRVGKITYMEGTCEDITERKALESRLLQAEKMEAIGTLAGGIAHDFNNILAAIIGYGEIIKVKFDQPVLHGYLDQILHSSFRAKALVGQILTFSRAGEQERQPVDLPSVVKEALRLLRATLPSTIVFRPQVAAEVHAVLANPTRVHQLLMNLGANAAHAMRERGGVLEVGLDNVEVTPEVAAVVGDLSPGSYVKLTVADTGCGMTPEVIHRIFDPFFTTKSVGEGTGLGLSVVYGIVKDCGGAIAVKSEPGKGSVFTVYLPALAQAAELPPKTAEATPGGTERILFVDDEEVLVEMWQELLEDLGYRLIGTTDSRQALELFRKHPENFDLVVTDMTMPGLTGIDLAREILKLRPDMPIILCTGFNELITEEKAKEVGIREYAMKPLALNSIAGLIRKALHHNHLARSCQAGKLGANL